MGAGSYEIRIGGRLSPTVLAAFADLRSEHRPVETALIGRMRDQADLHRVLSRLQDLGLDILEIRRLPHLTD